MGKITGITRQKHDRSRVSIYVDGEFVMGLDALVATKNRLAEGAEVEEETLERIRRESETSSAFECAMKFIGYRSRTERETVRHLRDRGYDNETIASVKEKLASYGYLDDLRFCREYVAAKSSVWGRHRIRAELMRLGADAEAADEALSAIENGEEAAYAVAEKYARTHRGFTLPKLKNHLYSRGFDYDEIASAASRIAEEYGEEDD